MKITVEHQPTPNPQSLKFVVNKNICDELLEFTDLKKAGRSPLVAKILNFPWVRSVLLGHTFVTITAEEWAEWDGLCNPIGHLIKEHIEQGEEILLPEPKKTTPSLSSEQSSPEAEKIKQIIRDEIQPAVAMDGGFIQFVSYEDKKVYVSLQGACSGCPSASITLKAGIEGRLKQVIPEIEEVIAL